MDAVEEAGSQCSPHHQEQETVIVWTSLCMLGQLHGHVYQDSRSTTSQTDDSLCTGIVWKEQKTVPVTVDTEYCN